MSALLLARGRGLTWAWPGCVLAVGAGAWCADALESQRRFDALDRVPAVVITGLVCSILATACLQSADEELDGAASRPGPWTSLGLVMASVLITALAAMLLVRVAPLERGGLELARDAIGLTGLGLLGASLAGAAGAWMTPFLWAGVSYFGVPREHEVHPEAATWGWLMFPATWPASWVVAVGLLALGLVAYRWGGFRPLPRRHPLRQH